MKRMAMALAAALMVLGVSTAFAATPSKTTTDVTRVKEVAAVLEDGTTAAADGWDLEITEDAELSVDRSLGKYGDVLQPLHTGRCRDEYGCRGGTGRARNRVLARG